MTVPGGKPVMARVGHEPRFPLTTVGPVFVTPEPANTAKLSAVPRSTGASWALLTLVNTSAAKPSMRPRRHNGPMRVLGRFSFMKS
jgi:hypothetical protein